MGYIKIDYDEFYNAGRTIRAKISELENSVAFWRSASAFLFSTTVSFFICWMIGK